MSELKLYKFASIYEMSSGISSKPEQAGHGSPFLSFKTVFNNYFLPNELTDLMHTSETEQKIYSVKEGDIFLTRTSETLDELGMSSVALKDYSKATFSGFLKRLRPIQSGIVYHKYMAFYLRSLLFRKTMSNNAIMTLRASLNEQIFSYLNLLLPSYEKQKKAGDLLFLIYDKIELNNRINAELEAMAKTLYDYWFVQFDFPNEEGKPYKSSGGNMVWNEKLKREIPEGWSVNSVFNELDVQYGFPFSTESFTDEPTQVPVVRIRDILDNSVSAYSLEEADEKYLLNKQDLLIGMDGNFHMNYWSDNMSYLNQRSVRLRAKYDSNVSIVQAKLDIQPYIKAKELNAKGSTVGHLSDRDMKELQVLVCPFLEPKRRMDAILGMIIANRNEIQNLTKQRDELLPLLMNGQVTVNSDLSTD